MLLAGFDNDLLTLSIVALAQVQSTDNQLLLSLRCAIACDVCAVLACPNLVDSSDSSKDRVGSLPKDSSYSSRLIYRITDKLPALQLPSDIQHIQLETKTVPAPTITPTVSSATAAAAVAAVTIAVPSSGNGFVQQVRSVYMCMHATVLSCVNTASEGVNMRRQSTLLLCLYRVATEVHPSCL
jgi:hypothetical protein